VLLSKRLFRLCFRDFHIKYKKKYCINQAGFFLESGELVCFFQGKVKIALCEHSHFSVEMSKRGYIRPFYKVLILFWYLLE